MAWPVIPTQLIYTDAVKSRSTTWTADGAGGRMQAAGPWSLSWIPCLVTAVTATDQEKNSREGMLATWTVTADNRLGYNRDELLWQATGSIFTIVGAQAVTDGTGHKWDHACEEHPIH